MSIIDWVKGMVSGGAADVDFQEMGLREITEKSDIQEVLERSVEQPVFVLKHSTQCPVSAAALRRVTQFIQKRGDEAPVFYVVKVIENRELSDEIAKEFRIRHESPQLILFNMKQPMWNVSHGAIDEAAMESAIEDTIA